MNARAQTSDWQPDWATHPGEHLAEIIEARGWTQAEFARLAGMTPKLVSTIISGKSSVSAETALKLERVTGMKAYIWTGLQSNWDLHHAREAENLASASDWMLRFPVRELQHRGIIPKTRSIAGQRSALLSFFGIGSPEAYEAKVHSIAVQHRQSKAHASNEHHVFTWLMLGEAKARAMDLPAFDARLFLDATRAIRDLTVTGPDVFEPEMRRLCAQAGVALIFEKPISKTRLFGSARWIDGDRPIIQMSLRMKSNDHFWWTFFHEAAHIHLHRGRNFMDDQGSDGDGVEREADDWATEALIGRANLDRLISARPRSEREVIAAADALGLHPGIIVGMLQHHGIIHFSHLAYLKARFDWADEA